MSVVIMLSVAALLVTQSAPAKPRPDGAGPEGAPLGQMHELHLNSAPYGGGDSARYDDASVLLLVPPGCRTRLRDGRTELDLVIFFHGQFTRARTVFSDMRLGSQFIASERNAVLIVPQGPVNAADNNWGRLHETGGLRHLVDDILDSKPVAALLSGSKPHAGRVILVGHSGAYQVLSFALANGGVRIDEAWLFDGLFGQAHRFVDWLLSDPGLSESPPTAKLRFVSVHARTDVRRLGRRLLEIATRRELTIRTHDSGTAPPAGNVLTARGGLVIYSRVPHMQVASRHELFKKLLQSSCLEHIGALPKDPRH